MITVSIDLRQPLAQAQDIRRRIQRALAAGQAAIYDRMARYPPARPGQRYRRTGHLGQRLVTIDQPGVIRVMNTAAYAPYVYGPKQARVHRGRWPHVRDLAELGAREVVAELTRSLRR